MNKGPAGWVREEIRALAAYPVAPSAGLLKLDAMENPYRLPAAVAERLGRQLAQVAVNRYPDPGAPGLKAALRRAMAIPEGLDMVLGNGSEVKQFGDKYFPAAGIAFADVHKALAYAAAGDEVALEKLLGELRARQQAGKLLAGPIVPALAEAFDAFARKDYAKAIALIEPHMAEHERIGGSRAQRRLIELTLDAARSRATRS